MIEFRKLENTYLQLCARLAWTAISFFVANASPILLCGLFAHLIREYGNTLMDNLSLGKINCFDSVLRLFHHIIISKFREPNTHVLYVWFQHRVLPAPVVSVQPHPQAPTQTRGFVARRRQWTGAANQSTWGRGWFQRTECLSPAIYSLV